jgi:hypothetical protein
MHYGFSRHLSRPIQQEHASHRVADTWRADGADQFGEMGEVTKAAHATVDKIDKLSCLPKTRWSGAGTRYLSATAGMFFSQQISASPP